MGGLKEKENMKKEITRADVASFLLAEIQRTAPDELSPQMIIHDLTALKVNKLPAMQRSIDAAIQIIKCKRDAQ